VQIAGLIEWAVFMQHREYFFKQRQSDGMNGFMAIVSLT
jgi:hypothetical protein